MMVLKRGEEEPEAQCWTPPPLYNHLESRRHHWRTAPHLQMFCWQVHFWIINCQIVCVGGFWRDVEWWESPSGFMKAQKAASWSNSQLRVALLPMLGTSWSAITWWIGWWTDDYGNNGKDCEDFDDVGGDDCDDGDDENDTAYYTKSGGDVTMTETTKYLAYTSRLDTITIAKETCKSDFFQTRVTLPEKCSTVKDLRKEYNRDFSKFFSLMSD